jgi:hypothetical protein
VRILAVVGAMAFVDGSLPSAAALDDAKTALANASGLHVLLQSDASALSAVTAAARKLLVDLVAMSPSNDVFTRMLSVLKSIAAWLPSGELASLFAPYGDLAKLDALVGAVEAASDKHVWLLKASHKDGTLDVGLTKELQMHPLTSYASLRKDLEATVEACGAQANDTFAGALAKRMQGVNDAVVTTIFDSARASFTGSLSGGQTDLRAMQFGTKEGSYRAGLAPDALLDVALGMAQSELHGKHSFDAFDESVAACWKSYDALKAIGEQKELSVADVDALVEPDLVALRAASATYIEWHFTLGLLKPKLTRNSVALMRYVAPLARMIDGRAITGLHSSIQAGITRAQKQDVVL